MPPIPLSQNCEQRQLSKRTHPPVVEIIDDFDRALGREVEAYETWKAERNEIVHRIRTILRAGEFDSLSPDLAIRIADALLPLQEGRQKGARAAAAARKRETDAIRATIKAMRKGRPARFTLKAAARLYLKQQRKDTSDVAVDNLLRRLRKRQNSGQR